MDNAAPALGTAVSMERVGRDGALFMEFVRSEGRTVMERALFHPPLQILKPMRLEEDGGICIPVLNPSGGLVGGDRLSIEARLGAGCRVVLTTPSATKVYRSSGRPAVQTVDLDVGPAAVLEWMPDSLIPFKDSRFDQRITARLADGAVLLLWDAVASGRAARGERWAFVSLKNEILIVSSDGGAVMERYDLTPGRMETARPSLAGTWDYFASFYIITGRSRNLSPLSDKLFRALEQWPDRVLGGVSTLSASGLAVKMAARNASDLTNLQTLLWDIVRREILGTAAPFLRKY